MKVELIQSSGDLNSQLNGFKLTDYNRQQETAAADGSCC